MADCFVSDHRCSQLAGLILRPSAQLEWLAASAAYRHGEEGWDPARGGQLVRSEKLLVLPPVHLTHLPPKALGGHAESPGAAA